MSNSELRATGRYLTVLLLTCRTKSVFPAVKDLLALLRLPAGRAQAFHGAGHLIRAAVAHAPGLSFLAFALLLAAAVTEAFGLALIVPLLYITGLAGPADAQHPIADSVARAAAAVGVELTLPVALGVFLALAGARTAAGWQRQRVLARIRLNFVDRLREDLYESAAGARWARLALWRPSDIHHTLTSDVNRAGQSVSMLFQLAVGAVLALVQLAVAILIAPLISLGALLAGSGLVLLTGPLARRSRRHGDILTQENRKVHAVVADFLAGLKPVKCYNAEALHVGEYKAAARAMRHRQLASTATASMARAVLDMGAACLLAALVYFAITRGGLALPELLVLVFVFARLMPALSRLQQSAQQLAHTLPAYVHAANAIGRLRQGAEAAEDGTTSSPVMRDALTVRDVSFAYPETPGKPVLKNVCLRVAAGEFLAVMGPTGAGKSTLADLLLGLLEPCRGEIRIDGTLLAGANARRWRNAAACVPQDPYLFHESIRANMRRAAPGASDADIRQALDLAAAGDFVDALPQGLDTVVGERGARLSGGERQRIALAQALLRKPSVLVLDEATGHLDARSEHRVLAALASRRAGMTVVAMTHRMAPAKQAERVMLLESGRVTAIGAWRDLAPKLKTSATAAPSGA